MPNGHDKNWIRVCVTINGFRARHGHWPTQVRLPARCLANIRDDLFTPEDYACIVAKITFVEDESCMMALDADGRTSKYNRRPMGNHRRPAPPSGSGCSLNPNDTDHPGA